MKYHYIVLLLLTLGCNSGESDLSQPRFLPSDYSLDGSVSMLETYDSIQMKIYYSDENLIIKESKDSYYVGVKSNSKTILSAYKVSKDTIKVMHASASLGETNFLNIGDHWVKDRLKWDWRYRDTVVWGRYHKRNYLHQHPIQDFNEYFQTYNWVANTVSFGSNREMEFVISKKMLPDITSLLVTYQVSTSNGIRVMAGPKPQSGITLSDSLNALIHEGALPLLPDTLPGNFFNINQHR